MPTATTVADPTASTELPTPRDEQVYASFRARIARRPLLERDEDWGDDDDALLDAVRR